MMNGEGRNVISYSHFKFSCCLLIGFGIKGKIGFRMKNEAGDKLKKIAKKNKCFEQVPLSNIQKDDFIMDTIRWKIPNSY